jgi:hypothetical protein
MINHRGISRSNVYPASNQGKVLKRSEDGDLAMYPILETLIRSVAAAGQGGNAKTTCLCLCAAPS